MSEVKEFTVEALAYEGEGVYTSLGVTKVQAANLKGARYAVMDRLWSPELDRAGCWAEFRFLKIADTEDCRHG